MVLQVRGRSWSMALEHALTSAVRTCSLTVATNYALTRIFPKPERHLFYDSGAGSTRATIVEFSMQQVKAESIVSIGATQKEAVVIDVLSLGWDREAGGVALDLLLRDILVSKFEQTAAAKELSTPVRQNGRAMAKFLKEAARVKQVLSANAVASSGIEGVAEDRDWRGRVEREEFEAAIEASGLVPRFSQPVTDALKNAGLQMKDLDSIVLVGGNTRVPIVQQALKQGAKVPEDKIAQNVNADEAAVMGAAFYGASFNPQFRMKAIQARDGNPYPVILHDASEGGKGEVIFPATAYKKDAVLKQYGASKQSDFVLSVAYDPATGALDDGFGSEIAYFNISGIDATLADLKASGDVTSVETDLNVTIVSRPLGTFSVQSALLNVKPKVKTGLAGTLKSFFGVTGSTEEDAEEEAEEVVTENADNSTDVKPKKKKKPEEPKDKLIRLSATSIPQGEYHPPSDEEVRKSKDTLYLADKDQERRAQREEARNTLEGYIYRIRDLLDDERFKKASKKQERERIGQKTDDLSSYLSGEGDMADISKLKLRRADLEALVRPIERRISEAEIRDQASKSFVDALTTAHEFVDEAMANLTQAMKEETSSKYSRTELESLRNSLKKDQKWFEEGMTLQKKRKYDEDPAILVEDMQKRQRKFGESMRKMKRRKIAKTRPPKKAAPVVEEKPPVVAEEAQKKPSGTEDPERPPAPEEAAHAEPEAKTSNPVKHEEL